MRGRREHMDITAGEIAKLVGGELEGSADVRVTGVASIDEAREGDVVMAEGRVFFERAASSPAACIVTGKDSPAANSSKTVIRVSDPGCAFAKILQLAAGTEELPKPGVAPGAAIEEDVSLGEGVAVGANCFVGRGARIGNGSVLFPNVCVGAGVTIGEHSKLYPGVTVYPGCTIGSRVILHAGVVIGADGFGYTCSGEGLTRYPHVGTVVIGDDVEIGANSTVDRAKTGATSIGSGTKIDNLVHIAHNVTIGRNCVIVALSGVAGSVRIGDGVTLAAQTGVKDHVRIGDGAVLAARAGVIGDVADGAVVSGFPARDHRLEKRVEAARLHLPEILKRLRALEKELENLRGRGVSDSDDDP